MNQCRRTNLKKVTYLDGRTYIGKNYDDVLGRVMMNPYTSEMTPEQYMNQTANLLRSLGKLGGGRIDTSNAKSFFCSLLALGFLKAK